MYQVTKKMLHTMIKKSGLQFTITIVSKSFENNYDDNGVPITEAGITPIIRYQGVQVPLTDFSDYKGDLFATIDDFTKEICSTQPIIRYQTNVIDINDLRIVPITFKIKGVHKYDRMYKEPEAVQYTNNELIEIALPLNILTKEIRKNDIIESPNAKYRVVKEYQIGNIMKGLEVEREY